MVQPEEIRKKSERIYADFLRAWVADGGISFFPRLVPTDRNLSDDVADAIRSVRALRDGSKEVTGYGYTVEWRKINSRTLGRNWFPERITFETRDDLLRLVGKQCEFAKFTEAVDQLRREFPELAPWIAANIRTLVAAADQLSGLLAVVQYFFDHPRPGCFARELPLEVDTKFVERNSRLLQQWFDLVLPPHAIRADEMHFERRYGLRYVEPQVFVRFLDVEVQREMAFPCVALSLPLHTLGNLTPANVRVIIVENQVNLLTMPQVPRTIAFGGMGNGVTLLGYVSWLAQYPITYWGDLDVEGLEILSRLRAFFPHIQSILMDESTLHRWRHLTGLGTGRCREKPPHLTSEELAAFRACCEGNLRLEQERIPQPDVYEAFRSDKGFQAVAETR
jgi:hypothetical protein